MAEKQLSDGTGVKVGQSATDPVGFHGEAGSSKIAVVTLATAATILTVKIAVQAILAGLKAKGLMASS